MKKDTLDLIDPIHGFIRVNKFELEIINSPAFQRLRLIRQLSGAHLTYPGAHHTRFEHSLGVMHIAGQAGLFLVEKGLVTKDQVEQLRIGALLHDIGHGPFSHLSEELIKEKTGTSHEEMGKKIITETEISDVLSKSTLNEQFLTNLAFGECKLQFMNEIISGILSADMMDYLLRDGYFTGAEHAKIDHNRMIRSFDIYDKKLALEQSAQYSFESMLHSRHQMFKAVYFHKTVRAAEVMLLEALRLADKELQFTSLDVNNYLKLTDEAVLTKILSLPQDDPDFNKAAKFVQDYQNRNLLKCVFERIFTSKDKLRSTNPKDIRQRIADKSQIDKHEIFVDTSITPSIPLSPAKHESRSIIFVSGDGKNKTAKTTPISELPLVVAISGFINILRVYTRSENRDKVKIASDIVLGESS